VSHSFPMHRKLVPQLQGYRWPAHLVTAGGWDLAGAANPLSGARLPYSSVGPSAQLVWAWPNEAQREQYLV
jgi:hypothetical protein